MSRINTNVGALTAQRGLASSQANLQSTLQRLSSGLQINTGADDPAGLIASESLRSEIAGLQQAVSNSQRAQNVIATAEGSLNEVSSLLVNIKSLIVQSANSGALSPDELKANQLQVDSAIQSITRISDTTTFAGLHLINGSLDYLTSGVDNTTVKALNISQANFGANPSIPVQVSVVTSAQPAQIEFANSSLVKGPVTLQIQGNDGVQTLSFASGTAASSIAFAVNGITDSTGVTASFINKAAPNSGIVFASNTYGSKSFVSVRALSGAIATQDTSGAAKNRSVGRDVVATVNGATTVGDGLTLQVNNSQIDATFTLNKSVGLTTTNFAITGGGAKFQLGAQVSNNQQQSIGIQSVAASNLGDNNVGFLSDVVTGGSSSLVGGNAASASKIIDLAINQVAVLRGKLGAFEKNTLATNQAALNVTIENVTSSESTIRDANFAIETSNLTRSQILVQAGTSVLATANSTPQNVLSLLK